MNDMTLPILQRAPGALYAPGALHASRAPRAQSPHTAPSVRTLSLSLAAALALMGCASSARLPEASAVQSASSVSAPSAWQAALPHGGSAASLSNWWAQWGDSALLQLLSAAQQESPQLSAARARIAQARAALTGAQSASQPSLNASAQASRGVQAPGAPAATSLSAGLQAGWEMDLFGGNRATTSAAQLRLRGAELGWHDARVAVAADIASLYTNLRYCESAAQLSQSDATSRAETARLAELTAQAGLNAPANAALARASAADAAASVRSAQAQCDVLVKSLVALSGLAEPALRDVLKQKPGLAQVETAQAAMFSIASLPADVLAQRPDIASAQGAVLAASLDAQAANARRLPVLSLAGSIGAASVRQAGITQDGLTWSLGPVAISVPLLDGGRTAANTQAAVAAYDDAVLQLRATARSAVREVETALVNLQSAQQRRPDVQAAATGYQASLNAAQSRYKAGLASLVELEDARRTALFAQQNLIALERDRRLAWVSLYRAAGGGWRADDAVASSAP
jgi:outer membrane protein, multidrug efflux system